MDEEDRKDIIKKINTSGDDGKDNEDTNADNQDDSSDDSGDFGDFGDDTGGDMPDDNANDEEGLQELSVYEAKLDNLFLDEPKRNNMFQPGSNDILKEGGEGETPTRYMFFSNLEQMRRQAGLMLDLDEGQIEAILNSGHDWAADHIAEAKNNMDQVFDFLMNETKSGDAWKSVDMEDHEDDEYAEWSKPMQVKQGIPVSNDLAYHLQNEIALGESVFRYGSDKFFSLVKEIKSLYETGLITLNENDAFIVNDFDLGYLQVGDDKIKMNFIFEEIEDVNEVNIEKIKSSCRNKIKTETERSGKPFPSTEASIAIKDCVNAAKDKSKINETEEHLDDFLFQNGINRISLYYMKHNEKLKKAQEILNSQEEENRKERLDNFLLQHGYEKNDLSDIDYKEKLKIANEILAKLNEENKNTLTEAEYQGKTVEIGKPKRGGSKKFYVYVRNPKTGKVKKVSFGAKSGGGNLAVKLKDPKARKAFADRHNCEQKNDKTKAGYWACRLPRYAKLLGLSGGGRWW